jgi:acetyltransferase-like isoleucine patch superfamily enzyme
MAASNNSPAQAEGRGNLGARLIASAYGRLPGRVRGLARRMISSLEGGEMLSVSLRQVMRQHHGVEAGLHSYGCFDPSRFTSCTIGRYVSIGPGARVFRRNHPTDRISLHPYFYNTTLGVSAAETMPPRALEISDDVWIGANAVLLPGCGRIGRGAVIGAGAVVTRDVPDYAVAAGNPARIIRQRFPAEIQDMLHQTHWWTLPKDDLVAALPLLQQPLTVELATIFRKRMTDAEAFR